MRGGTGRVVRVTRWTGVLLLCATLVAITVLTGCGSEGPDGGGGSSAPTVTGSTSTGEVTTTTDDAPAVPPSAATTPRMTAPFTVPPPTTSSTALAPVPGQPCTPGSSPDCIDPEGDGSYVYLLGGAGCTASPIAGGSCGDLGGDDTEDDRTVHRPAAHDVIDGSGTRSGPAVYARVEPGLHRPRG